MLLLGVWTGIDTTAALQIMVSQPLVAGTLTGWALGDPLTGALVGVVLQAFWCRDFALGGASFPKSGPATVAAAGTACLGAEGFSFLGRLLVPDAATLTAALLAGLVTAEVGRRLVPGLRGRRGGLVRRAERAAAAGDPRGIRWANLLGIPGNGVLGGVLALGGFVLGQQLLRASIGMRGDGVWVAMGLLGAGLGASVARRTTGPGPFVWLGSVGILAAAWWGLR